ncbi:VOC family protein [Brevundimonas nasdae]|uniref:Glyoxalase n=1 Tax=Brevundimonas nasdae TaxID=172043 RepID=A0ABX8TNK7_9CAUL|nr:VOC family protein [Brevundimonas nasdae]QYC12040.1 glyoxalase [Brevundimonas nasdae]QYC14827.1 glyoxalase [Brevundimonas nasdae]
MTETDDILLDVADPEVSARFYERLLASRPVQAGADRALFVLASGRRLSLWRRIDGRASAAVQVGFRLEGAAAVDDLHIDWWDRGARIVTPPADMAQGRGFVAHDPDGHRLCVFALA